MAVWLVRAGRHGEQEDFALEKGFAVVGWSDMGDVSDLRTRQDVLNELTRVRPNAKAKSLEVQANQLWTFVHRIQVGDLVVLPLKKQAMMAVGTIKGPYAYHADFPPGCRHARPTEWIRKDVPRSAFGQDLLYSLGALMTVCQIRRNNAEQRIRAILKTGRDPLLAELGERSPRAAQQEIEEFEILDLGQMARDQIMEYLGRKFKGHNLARLVAALLEAQGYQTEVSPEGPDRGADIIAGAGPLGFGSPRLCVQVKSTDQPVDVKVLRELQGVISSFGADQGLLVSWSGFKQSVYTEARQKFFQIRLWDSGDLVRNLLAHYSRLPDEIKAELPLTQIWILVPEELE